MNASRKQFCRERSAYEIRNARKFMRQHPTIAGHLCDKCRSFLCAMMYAQAITEDEFLCLSGHMLSFEKRLRGDDHANG